MEIIYELNQKEKKELYDTGDYTNPDNNSQSLKKDFIELSVRYRIDSITKDTWLEIDGNGIPDDYQGTIDYIAERTGLIFKEVD